MSFPGNPSFSEALLWKCLAIFALLATGCGLAPDSTATFPPDRGDWARGLPEDHGWSTARLEAARECMTTDAGAPFEEMDAILIVDGHDIFHYGDPYTLRPGLKFQHDWASCGRSLMTTFYGMAFLEHGETVEALERSAKTHFDTHHSRSLDERILVKHLLGYAIRGEPPGSEWHYHSSYFDLYRILRDLDGVPVRYRLRQLTDAIGARWEPFEYWGHGQEVPFISIKATPAEAARWGHLWLHRGRWKDRQIVDPEFVDASVRPLRKPDDSGWLHDGEGLQIHLNFGGMWGDRVPRDAYAAFGAGGRIIVVIPSLSMVFAAAMRPAPYARRVRDGLQVRDIRNLLEPLLEAREES